MQLEQRESVSLYGAGGHCKVVIDILLALGIDIRSVVDDNPHGDSIMGVPLLKSYENIGAWIITVGDCAARHRIANRLSGARFLTAIHPSATITPRSEIGIGSVVMAGAIVNVDSTIGQHCIVNTGASVDHDCTIGDFCHIAPHVTLCGGVQVGECTWIGAGSVVKQGIRIGSNCMIGAGSVVVSDIPEGVVAYGNPCKVIRGNSTVSQQADKQTINSGGVRSTSLIVCRMLHDLKPLSHAA